VTTVRLIGRKSGLLSMALVTLVWLFLQAMNLSNHNLAVFLSPIFHVHLGKATSARYFELFAGLDFATLLIGVGQAFVASSHSSEFTGVQSSDFIRAYNSKARAGGSI
jgi:hypothetical protein